MNLSLSLVWYPVVSLLTWCLILLMACTRRASLTPPLCRLPSNRSPAPTTAATWHTGESLSSITLSLSFLCSSPTDIVSVSIQKALGACEERGREEASHQEAPKCLYALHEGNEGQSSGRMHPERERSHQPDPGQEGERLQLHYERSWDALVCFSSSCLKGTVRLRMKIAIIYSPSCHSKPAWSTKGDILKIVHVALFHAITTNKRRSYQKA